MTTNEEAVVSRGAVRVAENFSALAVYDNQRGSCKKLNLPRWKIKRRPQKSCGRERYASDDDSDNRSSSTQYSSLNVIQHTHILLPTATLRVHDNTGTLHTCRALLDSCSQAHFASESLVQRLALKKFPNCIPLQGINTVRAEAKYGATVQIRSMTTNYSATLDCGVLPRISGNVPGNSISYQE
ncbi:hypothetical protein PR048_008274 [Dryococelus australis]|uniref:Uncharacterized protein n=1 Tax=Dryococelus australis TaxID=614101 RepID=A0ABQ9HWM9_9NEOP|nr:hypothetical protein PR048_008274 [Dryococelus australis]